jgi:hypothetical protein
MHHASRFLPGRNAQQRGFAGAVAPDQADPVASRNGQLRAEARTRGEIGLGFLAPAGRGGRRLGNDLLLPFSPAGERQQQCSLASIGRAPSATSRP